MHMIKLYYCSLMDFGTYNISFLRNMGNAQFNAITTNFPKKYLSVE